jgi:hypothetical protein
MWKAAVIVLITAPLLLAVSPALVVPAVLYVMLGLCRLVNDIMSGPATAHQKLRERISRHRVAALVVTIIIGAVTAEIVFWALRNESWFKFWMQVATGNWSPDNPEWTGPEPLGGWLFAFSILLAIALNLGAYGTIILYGNRITNRINILQMEQTMNLRDVYLVRDLSIRTSIVALLNKLSDAERITETTRDEIKRLIDQGFEDGDHVWSEEHLATLFGEKDAALMRELLRKGRIVGDRLEL